LISIFDLTHVMGFI